MKHHHLTRALALISLLAAAPAALAQTPALVPYQGRVQTGTPAADFTGTGQFKFALMQGTTTTRLWNNNGPTTADPVNAVSVTVTNGLYSVMLGDASLANMAAIPPAVFANADVRLRVWFNGTLLSPDQRLAPNGYLPDSIGGAKSFAGNVNIGSPSQTAQLGLNDTRALWKASLNTGLNAGRSSDGNFAFFYSTDNSSYWRGLLVGDNADGAFVAGGQQNSNGTWYNRNLLLQHEGGNVGIGTTSPAAKLDVSGNVVVNGSMDLSGALDVGGSISAAGNLALENLSGSAQIALSSFAGGGWTLRANQGTQLPGGAFQLIRTGTGTFLTVTDNGNVGIGPTSTSPTQAKLVVNGGPNNNPAGAGARYVYLDESHSVSNAVHVSDAGTPDEVSIYANKAIWSGTYIICSSDERIKTIRGRSNSTADLQTVRALQITDYNYKDTVANSTGMQKKLIAQQVERVYPQAVNRNTNVVPDIYQKAAFQNGWVTLKTDLKKGDRVRLLDHKNSEGIHEVLEVKDGAFRTDFKPAGSEVFVYGREVNDFRTVDYDAISMLNVSATQELARQLDAKSAEVLALQKENAALKAALAENASKDKAQDEQLAALAKLLEDRAPSAAVTTVSTVTTQP